MTASNWRNFQGSMLLPPDSSGGSSGFESLPLTPPRQVLKLDEALSKSPHFSQGHTQGSMSYPHVQGPAPPSPLGRPPVQGLEGTPYPRPANCSPPAMTVDRDYRGTFSRVSSFNFAVENAGRNMPSPRASDKPPIPIYSRVGSLKASLTRNASSKDASAPHTLNRLLSMEKGEKWDDFSFNNGGVGSELDDKVLEKRQYDGSLNIWKILNHGSFTSKKLLLLITLNFAYSSTEFLIGLFTGRIGLVSDSFHLTFGCGVLTFSLFAMVMSRVGPDEMYTYGYGRLEVLAAFTNAVHPG